MPGLVPGIHVLAASQRSKTWMAGTSPAMTWSMDWAERVPSHFRTNQNHAITAQGTPRASQESASQRESPSSAERSPTALSRPSSSGTPKTRRRDGCFTDGDALKWPA